VGVDKHRPRLQAKYVEVICGSLAPPARVINNLHTKSVGRDALGERLRHVKLAVHAVTVGTRAKPLRRDITEVREEWAHRE
jgi:hypothetical protein